MSTASSLSESNGPTLGGSGGGAGDPSVVMQPGEFESGLSKSLGDMSRTLAEAAMRADEKIRGVARQCVDQAHDLIR